MIRAIGMVMSLLKVAVLLSLCALFAMELLHNNLLFNLKWVDVMIKIYRLRQIHLMGTLFDFAHLRLGFDL